MQIMRSGQSVLDMNRIIAREISVSICGREYDSLDPFTKDGADLIVKVMAAAQRERIRRGWITSAPGPKQEVLPL